MADPDTSSPQKSDISTSASIYSYQTRLMGKNASSPTADAGGASSSRINSIRENSGVSGLRRSGSGARIAGMGHSARGKSVDLVRGQWEAKIETAEAVAAADKVQNPASPALGRPRSMLLPNETLSSISSRAPAPVPTAPAADFSPAVPRLSRKGSVIDRWSKHMPAEDAKPALSSLAGPAANALTRQTAAAPAPVENERPFPRARPASVTSAPAVAPTPAAPAAEPATTEPAFTTRPRPPSISSFRDISPNLTGTSSTVGSLRNRSAADTLAEARNNARRRLEARQKASGDFGEAKVEPVVAPTPAPAPAPVVDTAVSQLAESLNQTSIAPSSPKTVVNRRSQTFERTKALPTSPSTPTKALPNNSTGTPTKTPGGGAESPRSSPFGERLRPAPRPADTLTDPQFKIEPSSLNKRSSQEFTPSSLTKRTSQEFTPSKLSQRVSQEHTSPVILKVASKEWSQSAQAGLKKVESKDPIKPSPASTPAPEWTTLRKTESREPIKPAVAAPTQEWTPPVLRKVASQDLKPTPVATPSKLLAKTPPAAAAAAPRTPKPPPFGGDVFSPSKPGSTSTPEGSAPKPKFAGLTYRAPTGPPKGTVSSLASRFATGDASSSAAPAPRGRVPSLSSDRRRLGKHLPRIVSGDQGWEGDNRRVSQQRVISAKNRKLSLSKTSAMPPSTEENTPPRTSSPALEQQSTPAKLVSTPVKTLASSRPLAPLSPSATHNTATPPTPRAPSTPHKRQSSTSSVTHTPKTGLLNTWQTTRVEVAGEEMKGLMSAIGASSRHMESNDKVKPSRLPLAASSAKMAPAPLPSRRLANMDRQRHELAAYNYLCHVGEAQQWIEGCLDEELQFGVTELEDGLRDGVVLAKLARVYEGEHVVRRIRTDAKHRYLQTDNINYFLNFVRNVGMPETFIFELSDLYNKKNVPKVIFCIHVLSHLLARLGRAERMNNLVGQFDFTDEQLAATQKDIQGVAMPNFQQVQQTLAKEAAWEEPEEEEETEDEKRDRELLECEDSITALQRHLRGVLARQRMSRVKAQIKLAVPIITRLQSQARGAASRKAIATEKRGHAKLGRWATSLQAAARAHLTSKHWQQHVGQVHGTQSAVIGIQAQARGMLARMRRSVIANELDRSHRAIVGLQATCRGRLARRNRQQDRKALAQPLVVKSIASVQAALRGRLTRQAVVKQQKVVQAHTATFTALQSHLRGALVRRQHKAREEKLDNAADYVVAIQSQARGALARRRKQAIAKTVAKVTTSVSSFQALARGRLAQQQHRNMQKALAKVEVTGSVGGLQAFLRTRLAKKHTVEQKKKLEFVQPDVIGFQAVARGYLARQEYREWRDYLVDPHTQGALVFLQSLIRGFLARRRLWVRTSYIHRNVDKVVKIQALWRGRQQRQLYARLVTGSGVDVPTIQHYMHLLDDTESDFRDQLRIDTYRKDVVELLRTNQVLETEVSELDTKIALILKNKMTFEDLVRAKRRHGVAAGDESFQPPGGGDPFTGVHLDRTSQRKLELYEHLFFTLQTQPKYLTRLLHKLVADPDADADRRIVEGVTLILFGFGHDERAQYLFHKLLQISIHEQILRSRSLDELLDMRFAITNVATQYAKPTLTPYLQNTLGPHVVRMVQAEELDLSTDPVDIYNRFINAEESLTGIRSALPRELDADQILQTHSDTRTLYIQHLQELRALTDDLLNAIMRSTDQMPYTVRLMAREALLALRVRFQDRSDWELWPIVARCVILPFILPAIVAPETYDIADDVNPVQRRNLQQIANLLQHIATQDFSRNDRDRLVRVPLYEYISSAGQRVGDWILDVAEVDFHVHEMLESTSEATPISITRTDIYGLLGILMRNQPALTAGKPGDPIVDVLAELEGPPIDYDRGKNTVRVRLTNRLATLQTNDPTQAHLRELEVQAKRHVLAVLRVQTGKDLYAVLLAHPTEQDEQRWVYEVHRDIALEQARLAKHNLPPTPAETEYQMESIRSLPFHEVKSRAIEFCMALVEAGRLSREDHFGGLLVSIGSDIKEKHRLRQKRKVDLRAMYEAHQQLSEKRQKFEEQIQSYHDYIDSAMSALQQKKKAPFMSKQYWHQRGSGKKSKFGSFKYTAHDLYERGILLSVNQYSPRQFDKLHVFISSNAVGVFTLEMTHPAASTVIGKEEMRMEDLLQAQFDNNVRLDLFDGNAAFNLNMLIHQINKKFYAS